MARNSTPESSYSERSGESEADDFDPQEHQACYVFVPSSTATAAAAAAAADTPPPKRRRTSKGKSRSSTSSPPPDFVKPVRFVLLFNGSEQYAARDLRQQTYYRLWSAQEERLNTILDGFHQQVLDAVAEFVANATPKKYDGKIPTALVLAGPNIAAHSLLFWQFEERIGGSEDGAVVVTLTSKDAPNLKAALKNVIKGATGAGGAEGEGEDEEEVVVGRRGQKLLNYDLRILQNWCVLHKGKKVVVAIQDTEAFETGVLKELVALFSAHLDRIPFVLLLGIATSLDIFHEKLPKATIRLMQGEKFDVERSEECLAQVFNDAVAGEDAVLRLGPQVAEFLLEKQRDHTQSIQSFIAGLKYAYMCHFWANPLSVMLAYADEPEELMEYLTSDVLGAVRSLASFRRFIEGKLELGRTKEVKELLYSDERLRSAIYRAVGECVEYGKDLCRVLEIVEIAKGCTASSSSGLRTSRISLYSKAATGELNAQSPLLRELLLTIKKMNSASLLRLLDALLDSSALPSDLFSSLENIRESIRALTADSENTNKPLMSEFDVATSSSLRTTAVSKKIQLSAHKSALSQRDTEYSAFVKQVYDLLEGFFDASLASVEDVFLNEVFFYNLPNPHREVLHASQRGAVENALARPAETLGCKCCIPRAVNTEDQMGEDMELRAYNPPTSILYQLYLESGALINCWDLWTAFWAVVQGEEASEGESTEPELEVDESTAQALFYRSVAEMKYMGFVKGTRKRVDHLQKLAWRGL